MKYEIYHNNEKVDKADSYKELRGKIFDGCIIVEPAVGLECTPEAMFPDYATEKLNYEQIKTT
jgi:hypothetical protein